MLYPLYKCAVGAGLLVAATLLAPESTADKSFKMAMPDSLKKGWDKRFNGLIGESFDKLSCDEGATGNLKVGKGCVDTGDRLICCESWELALECTAEGRWTQAAYNGDSCNDKPKE